MDWLLAEGTLWIKGRPGCGKTILMSFLVDRARGVARWEDDGDEPENEIQELGRLHEMESREAIGECIEGVKDAK